MKIKACLQAAGLMLLLGSLFQVGLVHAAWNHDKVKGAAECAECHENESEVWQETKHQKGFRDFSQRKASKEIAKRMGVKHIKLSTAVCTSCHYTVGQRKRIVAGVSCESCHGPSADWLDVHNDYGGEDKDAKTESAAHREQRFQKVHKLGMLRPDNLYGVAQNCYQCHIVANEQLVTQGKHKAGSDFDLLERMLPRDDREGNVYHGAKPLTAGRKQALQLTGYAVELELSLRALGKTSAGSDYASKMEVRAKAALKKLAELNAAAGSDEIAALVKTVKAAAIKPGVELNGVADRVAYHGRRYVASATGYKYGVPGSPPAAAKPKPKAVAKPAPKVAPKPAAKPKAVAKPKPVAKPAAKPAPRQQVAKVAPAPVRHAPPPAPVAVPSLPAAPALIAGLELLAPDQNLCGTRNPWLLGEQSLGEASRLPAKGCLSVQARLSAEAELYVFHNSAVGLRQLLPNACQAMGLADNRAGSGDAVRLPLDRNRNPAVLPLDGQPGRQAFYVVAVDDDRVRAQWQRELGVLAGPCGSKAAGKAWAAADFEALLQRFNRQYNGHLQWRVRGFTTE